VETADGKKVHLKLMPNPSHLEAVDPLVIGFARSKADILYNSDYDKILPVLIHGDASIAGQGIVYEVLQMCGLQGYYTGGTIHFVINNQIGFTTDFDDARSSDYCTSIAAMVHAPVFHVNGDDAEAVVKACEIATMYRQEFNTDIFIDMVCYRKHGHNEGDEPKFTQPQLYALIDKHLNPREVYTQFLLENGEPDARELAKEMEQKFLAVFQMYNKFIAVIRPIKAFNKIVFAFFMAELFIVSFILFRKLNHPLHDIVKYRHIQTVCNKLPFLIKVGHPHFWQYLVSG
jgi:2-oxoglutarate dehydrogenase E1 component